MTRINRDKTFGIDLFLPMLLITIRTFFMTWPFVSDKEYTERFANNFARVSEEVFEKYL